jgi:hypothetical protein
MMLSIESSPMSLQITAPRRSRFQHSRSRAVLLAGASMAALLLGSVAEAEARSLGGGNSASAAAAAASSAAQAATQQSAAVAARAEAWLLRMACRD